MKRDARGWIKVEDGLPEVGVDVILCSIFAPAFVGSGYLDDRGKWIDCDGEWVINDVTHWQPLPELPEELGGNDD